MSYLIFFLCCRHNLSHVVSAALRAVGNIVTGDDVQTQVELGSLFFSQSSIRNHGFSVLPIHTSKRHMRAIFIQVLKVIQHYDSFSHHCRVFDIKKKKLCHSLNQSDWKLKTPEPVVTCLFTVLVQQIILNCNALPSLLHLLSNSRESIRKEACWTISNITAGNRAQIQVRLDALNRIKNYIGCRINGLFLITLQLK